MLKFSLCFFLIYLQSFIASAQDKLTYKDIFNFDVNDEFQYRYEKISPNAIKIKISEKYFSPDSNIVYYGRSVDSYTTTVENNNGHHSYKYTFNYYEDTFSYPYSDSIFVWNYKNNVKDSCYSFHDSTYHSVDYCNYLVYDYSTYCKSGFEGSHYTGIYGKGLGYICNTYDEGNEPANYARMFYFRKDTFECGKKDSVLSLSVSDHKKREPEFISVAPNPTNGILNLSKINHETNIKLYDLTGHLVLETKTEYARSLNISHLSDGIYLFIADDKRNIMHKKIVLHKSS